jgi:hypothetical protein
MIRPRAICPLVALTTAFAIASPAKAEWWDKLSVSGTVSTDLRFVVENYRGATPGQGYDFEGATTSR